MTAAERAYADALFELAQSEQLEDDVLSGLSIAASEIAGNIPYRRLLENPAVPRDERLALLDAAFRDAVHPYVLNFCKILCEKRMLEGLPACEQAYRTRLDEARGILPVTAMSAVALTQEQKDALCARLAQKTGKQIRLENTVNAGLLGGVKLSYAGMELDGSAKGRLDALRETLTEQL